MTVITNIGRLFTGTDRGVVTAAGVQINGDRIEWVGSSADAPSDEQVVDAGGALVTPGLIDSHTHPVYAGSRLDEIARRSSGATYAEIAERGGGIAATVTATRDASSEELEEQVHARLRRFLLNGTTTVEAKTGYHLERDGELAAVDLLVRLGEKPDLPDVAVTFLPAHAVPPGYAGTPDEYIAEIGTWSADAARAGAVACDVFCDEGYFTVAQSRRVLETGRAAGLRTRIHADELARTGGAGLAAELGADSADHLLRATADDAAALADAGVVATLCPITAAAMGTFPPVRALQEAGVEIALGTDHNPGTSGVTDMTVVTAAAVTLFGMSVEDALTAATRGGARSLRLEESGVVEHGAIADLVLWDADHEGAFAWAWGVPAVKVWRAGELVVG